MLAHAIAVACWSCIGVAAAVAARSPDPPRARRSRPRTQRARRHSSDDAARSIRRRSTTCGTRSTRLPIAAGLACVLALRPRRTGTPQRQAPVIQTQIILAVVGAVVMLVVGSSLARAFGIVGAAGLVRYRAKIDDPKDAGVMLSTLAVGLAAGVGVWLLAVVRDRLHPRRCSGSSNRSSRRRRSSFTLKVKAKDPAALKPQLEKLLARYQLEFELRATSKEEICTTKCAMPLDRKTDRLSNVILKLDPENVDGGGVGGEEREEVRSRAAVEVASGSCRTGARRRSRARAARASRPAGRPSTAS